MGWLCGPGACSTCCDHGHHAWPWPDDDVDYYFDCTLWFAGLCDTLITAVNHSSCSLCSAFLSYYRRGVRNYGNSSLNCPYCLYWTASIAAVPYRSNHVARVALGKKTRPVPPLWFQLVVSFASCRDGTRKVNPDSAAGRHNYFTAYVLVFFDLEAERLDKCVGEKQQTTIVHIGGAPSYVY